MRNGIGKGIAAIFVAGVLTAGICCTGFASRDEDGKWFGNSNVSSWHWADKADDNKPDNPDDETPCIHSYTENSHTCTLCGEVTEHEYADERRECVICGELRSTCTVTCYVPDLDTPVLTRIVNYGSGMSLMLFVSAYNCGSYPFIYVCREVPFGTSVEDTELIPDLNIPKEYVEEKDGKTFLFTYFPEGSPIKSDLVLYGVKAAQASWNTNGVHNYENGVCSNCGVVCKHSYHNDATECSYCHMPKSTDLEE